MGESESYECESSEVKVPKTPYGFESEENKVEYRILGSGLVSSEYGRTPLEP